MKRLVAPLCALGALFATPAWAASPAFEGTAVHSNCANGGACSATPTTTTSTLLLAGGCFQQLTTAATANLPTATGITFFLIRRWPATASQASGLKQECDLYGATLSGAFSSAVSWTFSGGGGSGEDGAVFGVQGVTGAHTPSSPGDGNSGLPASSSVSAGTLATGPTFSTNQADDLAITCGMSGSTSTFATQPASGTWTSWFADGTGGGAHANIDATCFFKSLSATQSGVAADINSNGNARDWLFVVDAITADAVSSASAPAGTSQALTGAGS